MSKHGAAINGTVNVAHPGLTTMKPAVAKLGARAVDGRTTVGKALGQWRNALIEDLGGRNHISTQQLALVDLAARSKLFLDSIDAWLVTQPCLVDKRRRALFPVVRERQQLADALARHLGQLGLERRVRELTWQESVLQVVTDVRRSANEAPSLDDDGPLDEDDGPAPDDP